MILIKFCRSKFCLMKDSLSHEVWFTAVFNNYVRHVFSKTLDKCRVSMGIAQLSKCREGSVLGRMMQ